MKSLAKIFSDSILIWQNKNLNSNNTYSLKLHINTIPFTTHHFTPLVLTDNLPFFYDFQPTTLKFCMIFKRITLQSWYTVIIKAGSRLNKNFTAYSIKSKLAEKSTCSSYLTDDMMEMSPCIYYISTMNKQTWQWTKCKKIWVNWSKIHMAASCSHSCFNLQEVAH